MIKEFIDTANTSNHGQFQAWRTKHQKGVFLTLLTKRRAKLHGARCQHLGSGPPYFDSEAGFGSLTAELKVCGSESDLLAWAKENGVTVERCLHCAQSGLVSPDRSEINTPVDPGADGVPSRCSYWIIKAKPERNDYFTRLPLKGDSGRWYTKRLPKTWHAGDTVFIWAGTPILRVIGRARLSNPDDGFDHNANHFLIEYLTNRIEGPSITDLRRDPIFRTASFLKSGPAGTVFPLTPDQGSRLLQLSAAFQQSPHRGLSKGLISTRREESVLRRRLGAGFGTAKNNQKVERAAIAEAKRYYERDGWTVQSVEADNIGFDFRCRKGTQERHVEVKGIGGGGSGFILTGGEYREAASDWKYELCLVRFALTNPKTETFKRGEIFGAFEIVPLAYKAVRAPGGSG